MSLVKNEHEFGMFGVEHPSIILTDFLGDRHSDSALGPISTNFCQKIKPSTSKLWKHQILILDYTRLCKLTSCCGLARHKFGHVPQQTSCRELP